MRPNVRAKRKPAEHCIYSTFCPRLSTVVAAFSSSIPGAGKTTVIVAVPIHLPSSNANPLQYVPVLMHVHVHVHAVTALYERPLSLYCISVESNALSMGIYATSSRLLELSRDSITTATTALEDCLLVRQSSRVRSTTVLYILLNGSCHSYMPIS